MRFLAAALLIAASTAYRHYGVMMTVPVGFTQQSETTTPYGRAIVFATPATGSQMPEMIAIEMIAPKHRTLSQFLKDYLRGKDTPVGISASDIKRSEPEKVCGGKEPAHYLELENSQSDSHGDLVMAVSNKLAVVATYMRGLNQAENLQARQALDSLCVK